MDFFDDISNGKMNDISDDKSDDDGKIFNNLLIGHQGQMFFNIGLRSRGTEIYNNIGLLASMYGLYQAADVDLANISIHDNYFEKLDNENLRFFVTESADTDGIVFSQNGYYSSGTPEFRINSTSYDPDQWKANVEDDSRFETNTVNNWIRGGYGIVYE